MSLSEKLEAARIALGKRKERELQQLGPAPAPALAQLSKPARAGNNNKLLAGNLAHEFLTHGTLLGRRIEPSHHHQPAAAAASPRPEPEPKRRYAELSWLLMTNGAHIPGVVNPTQLGRWLQIKE
ncbi:hypothetical protein CFC21_018200 [Triticum aestivum]|uniref:Uncharacterized protein n=3 Tax=Triticum TaxID=4564 RepID=A0A9R1P0K4_TRITD|nr:uncharacterized protein LOC123185771 [Triticum aestivum]KAF7002757.1 hypothetical protein CFC21_018200 [Triticum aestivum]VAH34640.1 unnamed protein product [Triticum turgidum subsp. durum]